MYSSGQQMFSFKLWYYLTDSTNHSSSHQFICFFSEELNKFHSSIILFSLKIQFIHKVATFLCQQSSKVNKKNTLRGYYLQIDVLITPVSHTCNKSKINCYDTLRLVFSTQPPITYVYLNFATSCVGAIIIILIYLLIVM